MSYAFEVTLGSQPAPVQGRNGNAVYPAHVSLGGTVVHTSYATDPGGPNAAEEMRSDVIRNFALILAEVIAAHEHVDLEP